MICDLCCELVHSLSVTDEEILCDVQKGKKRSSTCYSAQVDTATTEVLRYMAHTKQRRTYLPYTFPAVAGTHLPTPRGWRVE